LRDSNFLDRMTIKSLGNNLHMLCLKRFQTRSLADADKPARRV